MRIERASIGSTQAEAIARIRAGAPDGLTVVAARQASGRGRNDRAWASPVGGLYLSTAVRDPGVPMALVPLGIGAALAEALATRYAVPIGVKWPNDLLVPGIGGSARKLAGILVDRIVAPSLGGVFVVGVGMNVALRRTELPFEVSERAAILTELLGRPIAPAELEPLVLEAVRGTVARLARPGGPAEVVAACRARLFGLGRAVRVDGAPSGTLRTIAEDGALLVERAGAVVEVRAGEVLVEGVA